jgi:hypothetical protein
MNKMNRARAKPPKSTAGDRDVKGTADRHTPISGRDVKGTADRHTPISGRGAKGTADRHTPISGRDVKGIIIRGVAVIIVVGCLNIDRQRIPSKGKGRGLQRPLPFPHLMR